MSEERGVVRLTQKETAEYFGVTARTIKNWEAEDWFPVAGRTDDGYDADLIEEHRKKQKELQASPSPPTRFRPVCPRSPHHTARVRKRIEGSRVRHCVCESCGHSFKQVGPADPKSEVLTEIANTLSSLESHEVQGQQVVILSEEGRDAIVGLCLNAGNV